MIARELVKVFIDCCRHQNASRVLFTHFTGCRNQCRNQSVVIGMVNAQKIFCFRQCDGFGRRGRYNINRHLLTCFFCIGLFHRLLCACFWCFGYCLTKTRIQKIGQHLIGVDFHHRVFAVVESVTRYRFQKSDFHN